MRRSQDDSSSLSGAGGGSWFLSAAVQVVGDKSMVLMVGLSRARALADERELAAGVCTSGKDKTSYLIGAAVGSTCPFVPILDSCRCDIDYAARRSSTSSSTCWPCNTYSRKFHTYLQEVGSVPVITDLFGVNSEPVPTKRVGVKASLFFATSFRRGSGCRFFSGISSGAGVAGRF